MKLLKAACLGLAVAALAAAEDAGNFAGEVTASKLMLRAGPGEAYQPVVTVRKGTRLVVRGTHGNRSDWVAVEVPQGYHAWVFGRFISQQKDGTGEVTADRLLVRPRATTKYHHLNGRLNKGEQVTVVGRKDTPEGPWLKVVVPRRFPLYAHADFLKNVGPPALAEPKQGEETKPAEEAKSEVSELDRSFLALAEEIRPKLIKAETTAEIEPLRLAVEQVDARRLNLDNRERRYSLLNAIVKAEREAAKRELLAREKQIYSGLDERLREIERRYQERLRQIKAEFSRATKPRYVATGIVRYRPDLVGRYPSFRLEEGGKMRFFLIAPDYDLHKFAGKRVGVAGLKDPESGTGYQTIMVKRLEILGDQ